MITRNTVAPVATDAPTLQWANGKPVARAAGSSERFQPYVGFHSEVDRDADLDDAMHRAKIAQCEIKHQRPGGAAIVRHWTLGETIRFSPITSGPVAATIAASLAPRNAAATITAGLGMRWGQGERSTMAVRGYLHALLAVGYVQPVQLSVRSRMSDVLLAALIDHARICEAADQLIDRAKHPELVTLHEIALPLGPGSEQEWGNGDTATVVPFVSLHPQAIDAPYLRALWRAEALHTAALSAWPGIVTWAADFALRGEEVAHA